MPNTLISESARANLKLIFGLSKYIFRYIYRRPNLSLG